MTPIDRASCALQDKLANRPGMPIRIREYAAINASEMDSNDPIPALHPLIPLAIQAMLGLLTYCYPDSGIIAWVRGLFGRNPYAAMRAKAANLSRSDRVHAERIVWDAIRDHQGEHADFIAPGELVRNAEAVAAEMTDEEFTELIRGLKE